jgi:hypothetical protein
LVGVKDTPPKVQLILSLGTSWSKTKPPSFLDSYAPVKSFLDWIKDPILPVFAELAPLHGPLLQQWVSPKIDAMRTKMEPAESAIPFLTNTKAKHLDFKRYINGISARKGQPEVDAKYFRFNTPTEYEYIDMADTSQMLRLTGITTDWVADPDVKLRIRAAANILAKTSK